MNTLGRGAAALTLANKRTATRWWFGRGCACATTPCSGGLLPLLFRAFQW